MFATVINNGNLLQNRIQWLTDVGCYCGCKEMNITQSCQLSAAAAAAAAAATGKELNCQ